MILSAIIFCAGMYCGHVISPWIDEKIASLKDAYINWLVKDEKESD